MQCPICGQSFSIYWTRLSAEDRSARVEIQQALLGHHTQERGPEAHPLREFSLLVAPTPGYLETLGAYA
ncbi:MAG TPA: hypothetical protein VGM11_07315 [Acidobacteriaceae bacterium]